MRFRYRSVEFGTSSNDDLIVTVLDRTAPELRTDYVSRPLADGVYVGRDYLGTSTWTFELATNKKNLTQALEAAAALERVWRSEDRLTPGLVHPLEYELDGRWGAVYGRPGEFSGFVADVLAKAGAGRIMMTFVQTDPLSYGRESSSLTLDAVPASVGGLEAPLIAPLTVVSAGEPQTRFLEVGGNAPSHLTVTFNGPVTNPSISIDGKTVGLNGSLAHDEFVVIDGRSHSVTNNFGVSRSGWLTRATRLDSLKVSPGNHEVSFSGTDSTGTSSATISARSASYSL